MINALSRTDKVFVSSKIQTDTGWKIHCERTLDEAYYPALPERDLAKRNEDQVVSRLNAQNPRRSDENTPILMVSQTWLLGAGRIVVQASSESRGQTSFSSIADTSWTPYNHTAEYKISAILAKHIEDFGKAFVSSDGKLRSPSVLSLFETSVLALMSEVDGYLDPATSAKPEIDMEKRFTHDIWDIRSELAMISDILGQQERVFDELLAGSSMMDLNGKRLNPASEQDWAKGWDKVFAARSLLTRYQQRIRKIDADAERIDKAAQDMLNLKRTFASMQEAQNSHEATQASLLLAQSSFQVARRGIVLNAAVVGFTVVTVIFTPLSFLTGLFALPTDDLRRLLSSTNETKDVYVSKYLGGIFVGTELATLTFTASVVALSVWAFRRWERRQEHAGLVSAASNDCDNRMHWK